MVPGQHVRERNRQRSDNGLAGISRRLPLQAGAAGVGIKTAKTRLKTVSARFGPAFGHAGAVVDYNELGVL